MISLTESAVRKRARRAGYRVEKSRQQLHGNNAGQYQLVDSYQNSVVLGVDYDASLEWISEYVAKNPSQWLAPELFERLQQQSLK